MSIRTCPICRTECGGYTDRCIGAGCGEDPCLQCRQVLATPSGQLLESSILVWNDIDMEDDPPV